MRNAQPAQILDISPPLEVRTVSFGDDREMIDVDMTFSDADIERMRQGYVCIRCHEPQSVPFPEVCESRRPDGVAWCSFPCRAEQAQEFALQFSERMVKLGSQINWADEQEHLDEVTRFEEKTGIILPDEVKFPQGPLK